MSRAVAFVPVVLLALGQVALGQAPFVANHLVSDAAWEGPTAPFDYMDVPGSERTLSVPAGTVLITWTSTMFTDLETRIRPRIGDSFPADGTVVRGGRSSGSWLTTTEGGTVTIGLQVKSVGTSMVGQVPGADSLSWSVLVFPETAAQVPAVGTVGMVAMAVLVLGAGAIVMARRARSPV